MSQHKTSQSNWTAEQKQSYWERRQKGLRGQLGVVTVHRMVKDEKGKEQLVPVGATVASGISRRKHSERRTAVREQKRAFVRQQRQGAIRGE